MRLEAHLTGELVAERYLVEHSLGEGGAGEVFRAWDRVASRPVAIKFFAGHETSAEEFRAEAAVAMRARDPHLVKLLDAGVRDGRAWLALEYVEGADLRTRLGDGPLPVELAVRVARDLFSGLEALHRNGLIHGDIKPENVLFPGDRARVVDFGRSRLGHLVSFDGVFPGTPPYMHPALFRGGSPSVATDCFAAWVVLYELVAAQRPWRSAALRACPADALPPRRALEDARLEKLVAAGLAGELPDARSGWLALSGWARGHTELPVVFPRAAEADPELVSDLVRRARLRRSTAVAGDGPEVRATLEAVHRQWLDRGGRVLWVRADWGTRAVPLSGALALAGHAADALDGETLSNIAEGLGPLGSVIAAASPPARAWLGHSPRRRPFLDPLAVALRCFVALVPGPLLVLADGLDRLDGSSRRFLTQIVNSGEAVVIGSCAPGNAHGMPELVPLGSRITAAAGRTLPADLDDLVARARVLDLPFDARLAVAADVPLSKVEEAAIEAEYAGVARWNGQAVFVVPGPIPPPERVRVWLAEAAERLDAAREPLRVAHYALRAGEDVRLGQGLDEAVALVLPRDPAAALALLDRDPRPRTPERIIRHIQVALHARALGTARRLLPLLRDDPASESGAFAEAEGAVAFHEGLLQPALDAYRRAAAAYGFRVYTGVAGRLVDLWRRLGFGTPVQPNPRLARVLERLHDLHFCTDHAALPAIHAAWLAAAPDDTRARAVHAAWRALNPATDGGAAAEDALLADQTEVNDPAGASVVLLYRGLARCWRGETVEAYADALDAADQLLRNGDPYLAALATQVACLAGYHLASPQALRTAERSLARLVDLTGDRRAAGWLAGARGLACWLEGDVSAAMACMGGWAREAEERGDNTAVTARRYLGEIHLEQGDPRSAVPHLLAARRLARASHLRLDHADAIVIGLLVADGMLRRSGQRGLLNRAALRREARALADRSPRWAPRVRVAEAWQAMADGDPRRARAWFEGAETEARARRQAHDAWWALRMEAVAFEDGRAEARARHVARAWGIKVG